MNTEPPISKRHLIIFIILGLLICAFPVPPQAEEPIDCGDGPRYKIDMKELKIKYSSKSFEGLFGFLSKLKLGVTAEEKTLQKAAESTQQWNQLLIGLAEGYNSCAITKKQYQEAIQSLYPSMKTDAQKMLEIGKAFEKGQRADFKEFKRLMDEYLQKLTKFAQISGKEEIIERISAKLEEEFEKTRKLIERQEGKLDLILEQLGKSSEKDRLIADLRQKLQETEKELQKKGASEALEQFKQGNYEEAEKLFQKELQGKKAESARAAYYLGNIRFVALDFKTAANYYSEATQLDPNNGEYLNVAGIILYTLGKYTEAEPLYKRLLEIREKALGKDHPDVATVLENMADLYKKMDREDEEKQMIERARRIRLKNH
jgi:hypothetical protein